MQGGFSAVRRPDQGDLGGALGANEKRRAPVPGAFLQPVRRFGELLDPSLDIALQMVRALVLWYCAQHFAQPFEALRRVARLPKRVLGSLVFRSQVGRHFTTLRIPSKAGPNHNASTMNALRGSNRDGPAEVAWN